MILLTVILYLVENIPYKCNYGCEICFFILDLVYFKIPYASYNNMIPR